MAARRHKEIETGTLIDFHGHPISGKHIRAAFIGCGSHSFRNIYPALQFVPVDLVATCDLVGEKAIAFARKFGAEHAFADHKAMLRQIQPDAVFIVTGYDSTGRPRYPALTIDALKAGCHVWIEKPPAATVADIRRMKAAARKARKNVVVGLKKMFAPANAKACKLALSKEFGNISQVNLQYPQYVPKSSDFQRYFGSRKPVGAVIGFLDHICHPLSALVPLLGKPSSLYFERSSSGSGVAIFSFPSGAIASLTMTHGASLSAPMERTVIVSDRGRHIVVENNLKVSYYKWWHLPYGASPDFYAGSESEAASVWEPEFSLGQLYNKGLFLLGYYAEIKEFCDSIMEARKPRNGTLEQAEIVTGIFQAFAKGPGKRIRL